MSTSAAACTCGNSSHHRIARRKTADGHRLALWSDGLVTQSLIGVKGAPATANLERALSIGWLVFGEVEVYDRAELPTLFAAAKWTYKRGGSPADLRARFAVLVRKAQRLTPQWVMTGADARGKVTSRQWTCHRLGPWGSWGVIDDRTMRGGRYMLGQFIRGTRTLDPASCHNFTRLCGLLDFMADNAPEETIIEKGRA